jgi:hypothetical protein
MAAAAAAAVGGVGPGVAASEKGLRLQGQMDAAAGLAVRQPARAAGGARYQSA